MSYSLLMRNLFLLIVIGIFGFSFARADSGACSYHGGVNCSVSSGGNAVCNDGFVSSVRYSSMVECSYKSYCSYPVGFGCRTEDDYQRVLNDYNQQVVGANSLNVYRGLIGSPEASRNMPSDSALRQCRSEIEMNNAGVNSYKQCIQQESDLLQKQFDSRQKELDYQKSLTDRKYQQEQEDKKSNDEVNNLILVIKYCNSINAQWDVKDGKNICECSQGQEFNSDKNSCVLIPAEYPIVAVTPPTPEPLVTPAPIKPTISKKTSLKIISRPTSTPVIIA